MGGEQELMMSSPEVLSTKVVLCIRGRGFFPVLLWATEIWNFWFFLFDLEGIFDHICTFACRVNLSSTSVVLSGNWE